MNSVIFYTLLIFGALGHVIFWVGLVNRIHALNWSRRLIDVLTMLCGIVLVVPFAAALYVVWNSGWAVLLDSSRSIPTPGWVYLGTATLFAAWAAVRHAYVMWHPERRGALLANHTGQIDLRQLVEGPLTAPGLPTFLASLPGNEVLRPCFHEKAIVLPRLTCEHEGLKIAHLTDLHMSGRIAKLYFVEVVGRVNDWQPDLIVLTGDLVERTKCLAWIPDTLGKLRAAAGVCFILGNHDRHVDCSRLRGDLQQQGLIDVGGKAQEFVVGNTRLVVAGNELPWFQPAADLSNVPPHDDDGQPLRILLAHSPDQFSWAQRAEIDLMLAGHSHGGQVRFPLIGALLAPCRQGTRYACGVFQTADTVMHVSRGTSGLAPIRWNCPPEVALLTLHAHAGR